MRLLTEYLSTKVKYKTSLDEKSDLNDVINFLEEHSFKEIITEDYNEFIRKYKMSNIPVYCIGKDEKFIRFGNGNEEPIFFWRFKEAFNRSGIAIGTIKWKIEFIKDEYEKEYYKFNEFEEYIRKYFNWL